MVALVRFTVGGFGIAEDNNLDLDMELDLGYKVHKNIYAYVGWRARYESFSRGCSLLKCLVQRAHPGGGVRFLGGRGLPIAE